MRKNFPFLSAFARLAAAALALGFVVGCAVVDPADRKPLPPDYEPPPIDGFPSDTRPSRI